MTETKLRWKYVFVALLWWGLFVVVAFLLEGLFDSGGYRPGITGIAPIPAILITALLIGWVPASIIPWWQHKVAVNSQKDQRD